ncbi:MAG: hypothetical protein ACRDZU_13955 [Acidimicrobiales bacterium]
MVDQPLEYERCTSDERQVVLDALAARRNALLDEMFRVIVVADELRDFDADGSLTMRDWLAYRYNLSARTARQWVRAATALQDLPLVRERFAAGDISLEQLTLALSFARPADDARLAELLPALSCFEVEVMAKRHRRVRQDEHDEARRRTHLRLRRDRSGLGSRISGFLATEDAAIVAAALDRRAQAAGPDPETGLWAPHEQRAAGALRDLAAEDLARSAVGGSEPDTAVVVVHAPVALVDRWASETDRDEAPNATINGEPISNDTLHRILCDARLEGSIDAPDGRTVGVGRATRNPPAWLRRRVIGRDHGCCRWPGCSRPIRHLHHMTHWTEGGPTDAANLIGVCWHHHHLLHDGHWNASGNADQDITITSPFGRTIHSRAGPAAA